MFRSLTLLLTLVLVVCFIGCSSGKSNPVSVQPDLSIDSPIPLPETNADDSNRNLLGTWGVVGGDVEKAIMSGIVCDNSDNILTTGSFSEKIDLDPGSCEDFHEPARTQHASASYLMKILPNGYWE